MQHPTRRTLLRVLAAGGGAAAFPSLLAGCSTDYPEAAVAAWRGPAADADVRRFALAYAILAPNSHNRQPWLADLREPEAITLRIDRRRLLPETDPWFRQIVVSQGTFLEALALALEARGLSPRVELFPEGEFPARELDDRPVARVTWVAKNTARRDPLFEQLLRRHTAKVDYDTARPVSASTLAALGARDVLADPAVRFGSTADPARLGVLRELCWQAAKVELSTARTMMESVRLTRVGPEEIERHRDGIAINDVMPRLAAAFGAFDRTAPPAPGSTAYSQVMRRFEGHSRTAMGFVWLSTPTGSAGPREAQVRAGRAYMRLQLKATELGLQVHPMSQAVQEFAEMKEHYDRLHALLTGRNAGAEPVQMFCRVGYAPPQQHSPRRGVDAIVRA